MAAAHLGRALKGANDAGVVGVRIAFASAALGALAAFTPRGLSVGRVWSWIFLLSACGLANWALGAAGWWTPTVWPLVVVPLARLVSSGAWRRLVASGCWQLRLAGCSIAVSVAAFLMTFFPPISAVQSDAVQLAVFGGTLCAAACMVYALKESAA